MALDRTFAGPVPLAEAWLARPYLRRACVEAFDLKRILDGDATDGSSVFPDVESLLLALMRSRSGERLTTLTLGASGALVALPRPALGRVMSRLGKGWRADSDPATRLADALLPLSTMWDPVDATAWADFLACVPHVLDWLEPERPEVGATHPSARLGDDGDWNRVRRDLERSMPNHGDLTG